MSETLAGCAEAILRDWVQSESLRKHCYAVADSMKHFAQLNGEDVDLWEAVGLLHDMDYERHPNLERNATEGHPFVGVAWLRENNWSEGVCRAILSHADYSGVSRNTVLEKTLYAVDELSSFVESDATYWRLACLTSRREHVLARPRTNTERVERIVDS